MARTAILFGGTHSERRVSVASAQNLARAVDGAELWFWRTDGAVALAERDALLSHERPFEFDFAASAPPFAPTIEAALAAARDRQLTLVLGLHGTGVEDGMLAAHCEALGVPFTGSGSRASALAFDKRVAKEWARGAGIPVAPALLVEGESDLGAVVSWLDEHGRLVAKPVTDGSSIGLMFLARGGDLAPLMEAVRSSAYLVEPHLAGTEVTVGVHDQDGHVVALPVIEIAIKPGFTFDFKGKYLGHGTEEICPARIAPSSRDAVQRHAVAIHEAVGAFGYSRSDFILTEYGPVFLEINTLPGLTAASLVPLALRTAGLPFADFMTRQIALAEARQNR